jgi:membrane protein implicated in regulation of membrane protease activity
MLSGDILSQVYLASAILGVGFVMFNFITGQIGDGGVDGGVAVHDGGGFDSGGAAGHDFGAADSSGVGGHDAGASQGGSADGSDTTRLNQVLVSTVSHTMLPGSENALSKLGQMLLGMLSPMGLAIFLAFFGLTGLFVLHTFPVVGYLSLIPAIVFSYCVSFTFKLFVRWLMKVTEVSSESKVGDLVGQVAEVNIPFNDGATGEITYVVGSKRYNSPAKPFKPGVTFTRGSKVMIVDIKDHLVLVEPYADVLLS